MKMRDWLRKPLPWVLLTGFVVRVIALVSLRGDVSIRVPLLDALHYVNTATALAQGEGWPSGPHFMAPVYPFLLSGLFRLAPPSVLAVQWAQLALGLGTVALVTLTACRSSFRAGWTAGMLYALCGPAIAYENQVLMESLIGFALALFLYLDPAGRRAGLPALVASGIAMGIATAGRPTYLLLLPLAWALNLRGDREARWSRRGAGALLLGFLLVVLPPTLHNLRATGRISFVTTSGGLNLYIGNHVGASGIYSQPPGLFLEKDPTGVRSASRMVGRSLSPMEASDHYAGLAWDSMRSDPGRTIRLWIRKAGFLIGPAEVPQIESFNQIRADHTLFSWIGWIGFPLLFTLSALGLRRREPGWSTRRLALAILIAGSAAHIVFFSTGRYRAAMLPALSVLAGSGGAFLLEKTRGAVSRVLGLWPALIPITLMLVAPRVDPTQERAWVRHQQGIRYEILGAPRAAAESYRAALQADSTLGESWHNLGACEAREGRLPDAAAHYRRSLRYLGENPVALTNLAVVYGRMGMDREAVGYFDRALAADPGDLGARVDRGVALFRLGRREEAFQAWRQVAEVDPREPSLSQTLSRLASIGVELPPELGRLLPAK